MHIMHYFVGDNLSFSHRFGGSQIKTILPEKRRGEHNCRSQLLVLKYRNADFCYLMKLILIYF